MSQGILNPTSPTASSVNPCPGRFLDENYCVENCCLTELPSSACLQCAFLCLQPVSQLNCSQFCSLAMSDTYNGNNDKDVIIAVLATLVVIFSLLSATLTVLCLRHKWLHTATHRTWLCRDKMDVTCSENYAVKTANGSPPHLDGLKDKGTPDIPTDESSAPADRPIPNGHLSNGHVQHSYLRLDMDAGSVCEHFTDDEFHDAITPGSSLLERNSLLHTPSSSPPERSILLSVPEDVAFKGSGVQT